MNETDTKKLRKNFSVGSFAALVMFGALAYQFGAPAIGNVITLQKQNAYFWGTTDEQRAFVRERNFRTICPLWNEQNLFGKYVTYRDRAWCRDYVSRL